MKSIILWATINKDLINADTIDLYNSRSEAIRNKPIWRVLKRVKIIIN